MSIDNQVSEIIEEVLRLQYVANKAAVSMEKALKELTRRIKVIEDSVTTIEECDISEWNTPTKERHEEMRSKMAKGYLEEGDTYRDASGFRVVVEEAVAYIEE